MEEIYSLHLTKANDLKRLVESDHLDEYFDVSVEHFLEKETILVKFIKDAL